MSAEAELIRTAALRADYETFRPILKDQVILPEAVAILEDIGAWYDANPAAVVIDWGAFLGWAKVARRATWKPDRWVTYQAIVDYAKSLKDPNPAIVERFRELVVVAKIRTHTDALVQGHVPGALGEIAALAAGGAAAGGASPEDTFVTEDIDALMSAVMRTDGLEWRLEDLNVSIGPVGRGDLVMVGKRPEAGGTTFLVSEMTHMVAQLPEGSRGIIFTNEELGEKVKVRALQAALGWTTADIAADKKAALAGYTAALKGRRLDVVHRTDMSTSFVERVLRGASYGVIGINILDKISGFHKLEGVDRIRALGVWARGLADKHGTVIAINQADASAEGEKWLNQSQLYGSKTGLQGEADALIMLGATHNPAESEQRFLSVAKNKLPGGSRTKPNLRHGRFTVGFDAERARFETLAYKKVL